MCSLTFLFCHEWNLFSCKKKKREKEIKTYASLEWVESFSSSSKIQIDFFIIFVPAATSFIGRMATSMNRNDDYHQEPPVGFLLIFAEIFSNEQLAKALEHFRQSLTTIDYNRFEKINDLFNSLFIREKFQIGQKKKKSQ